MPLRPWIARGLTLLLGSLLMAAVAAILAGLLRAGGDRAAAAAVSGVLWVALTTAGLSLIGQIMLLSLEALRRPQSLEHRSSPPPDAM